VTDRLNAVLTPVGWTRYTIHTSANFERSQDQKIVAKVLVSCELTILGVGSNSATGEEWADNDNAGTSAEAQAFKRACCCFGLGRYLYYFVDLDERKRPKAVPLLPRWATPEGGLGGLRPGGAHQVLAVHTSQRVQNNVQTLVVLRRHLCDRRPQKHAQTPASRISRLADLERDAILRAITQLNGDKMMAAQLLGIGKTMLYRKLKEYGDFALHKASALSGR